MICNGSLDRAPSARILGWRPNAFNPEQSTTTDALHAAATLKCGPRSTRRQTGLWFAARIGRLYARLENRNRQGSAAYAGRRGMADRRMAFIGRAQILSVQFAGRRQYQNARRHQGALGLRAGPSADERRAWSRSFRGAIMARVAPARTHDHDRLCLPSASASRAGEAGKKESKSARRNRPCRLSDAPSSRGYPACQLFNNVRTATCASGIPRNNSANVVLGLADKDIILRQNLPLMETAPTYTYSLLPQDKNRSFGQGSAQGPAHIRRSAADDKTGCTRC